ncbi:hypothetical protein tb265_04480 [Gemmatimonadetes bacterium T265]|nr:hypothetical protein tb265_04480 [Gemmatimonadetes bacterium T265]
MSDPSTASRHPATEPTTLVPPGSIICPRCGAVVGAESRFCPACGNALAAPKPTGEDHLLTRLRHATQGEYEVLREIGRGGMAAVYLAWDRELARYVAIKVLLPELAHHPTMSQRFLQEARTAANLDDHPSVVRVYRAKESEGLRYFVMKYVDGCSLEQLLRSTGPLPPDLAVHVVDQVALALQYAHEHGVVHRDVKPGNVLLDRSGNVVVTDFGIAKVAEGEQLTRTGIAIGTPHYMSPEQWRIEPLTPASDQYALGAVAYYLLTGEVPFDGTQYAIQEHHLRSEPPALATRRDGVPPALDVVIRRMLAKAPAARYTDLRSVSHALAAIPRDSTPVLRERLSRLIPAVNMPGVREVPPPDVPPAHAPVAVERRSGGTPVGASAAVAPTVLPNTPADPPAAPLAPGVAETPVDAPREVAAAVSPPVGTPPAPALDLTTAFRPRPSPVLNADGRTEPATPPDTPRAVTSYPDVDADEVPADHAWTATPPVTRVLDGPITRQYSTRRIAPWVAAAVVAAVLVGIGVAFRSRAAPAARVTDSAATIAVATPGPPAVAAAPTPAPAVDSAALAARAADSTARAAADSVDADSTDQSTPPGPPTALLIVGAPPHGTLTLPVGDSVRLRARVNDARGTRLVDATVRWTSADPARVAFRNGWAVAVAPGGPVAVTASSGELARSVRLVVGPLLPAPPHTTVSSFARPTSAELRAEVQRFVAALDAHDLDAVARRLAPRAVDGSSAREFVTWLEGTQGLSADAAALGEASDEGSRARVAFRVPLRWRGGGGSLGDRGRKDVTFWMTLTHDEQGWHGGEVLLGGRVAP